MSNSLLDLATLSLGLLVLRVVVGLLMAAHGSQKLFGWFGGHGIAGTGMYFESIGFRPGPLFARVAATTGSREWAARRVRPPRPGGSGADAMVMIVAAVSVHWKNGLFAMSNGIEVALFYGTVAVGLALIRFGRYSLDALLGLQSLYTPVLAFVALAIGLLGGIGNLAARRPVAAA